MGENIFTKAIEHLKTQNKIRKQLYEDADKITFSEWKKSLKKKDWKGLAKHMFTSIKRKPYKPKKSITAKKKTN